MSDTQTNLALLPPAGATVPGLELRKVIAPAALPASSTLPWVRSGAPPRRFAAAAVDLSPETCRMIGEAIVERVIAKGYSTAEQTYLV